VEKALLFRDGNKYRISFNGKNIFFSKSKSWLLESYERKFLASDIAKELKIKILPEIVDSTDKRDGVVVQTGSEVQVSTIPVNDRFEFLENLVGMVITNLCHSMIVTGEGGLGKTFTVRKTLKSLGLEDDVDYKWISGFSTPKSLYRLLHDYRDKILIFDDCDSVFRDQAGENLLKAALDDKPVRKISWLSERQGELEPEFEFTGRVIFISNIPMPKFSQTLKSRSMMVDLNMTFSEKIDRMLHIARDIVPAASKGIIDEAMNFAIEHGERMSDFNFRTLEKIIKIRMGGGEKWENMAKYMTGIR